MMASLSVSVVVYHPAEKVLRDTLVSLRQAIRLALDAGVLAQARLILVDNGEVPSLFEPDDYFRIFGEDSDSIGMSCHSGHGNIGYGRGHNLALFETTCDHHLVLNPDVILEPDALVRALEFCASHPSVSLISPRSQTPDGSPEYLCKRYPALLDLLLRGFAPVWLKHFFSARLARYEYRDETGQGDFFSPEIISGCFMFGRTDVFRALNGFSPRYFMYFEDFDLSLRAHRLGKLQHVPTVEVTHLGGKAAGKGWRHIWMFARSARVFYRIHGLKVW